MNSPLGVTLEQNCVFRRRVVVSRSSVFVVVVVVVVVVLSRFSTFSVLIYHNYQKSWEKKKSIVNTKIKGHP